MNISLLFTMNDIIPSISKDKYNIVLFQDTLDTNTIRNILTYTYYYIYEIGDININNKLVSISQVDTYKNHLDIHNTTRSIKENYMNNHINVLVDRYTTMKDKNSKCLWYIVYVDPTYTIVSDSTILEDIPLIDTNDIVSLVYDTYTYTLKNKQDN